MKNKIFKIFMVIIFISLCIGYYLTNQNPLNDEGTIDLVGKNKFWKASLNIHLNYDSELIIQPRRDDFDIPAEINIDIIVNDNSLYTDTLKHLPGARKSYLGKYMVSLDSDYYLNKDINNIKIIIKYDNKNSEIFLN